MAKVVHFEILGSDGEKTRQFYSELFGWDYQVMPEMDYGMVEAPEGGIGGGVGSAMDGAPPHSIFYVEVADVQASLEKAASLGGNVVVPKTVIPDMVTFGIFTDTDGNAVGVVEADSSGK